MDKIICCVRVSSLKVEPTEATKRMCFVCHNEVWVKKKNLILIEKEKLPIVCRQCLLPHVDKIEEVKWAGPQAQKYHDAQNN